MADKNEQQARHAKDQARKRRPRKKEGAARDSEFIRAENEDDDGYDDIDVAQTSDGRWMFD